MYSAINLPSIGLNATPVATNKQTVIDATVVKLPYMGPNKLDTVASSPYPTEEHRLKTFEQRELGSDATRPPEFSDPCDLIIQRINEIAREYKCSESEAEAMLFAASDI